jgi:carbamoyl-phosphate synthase large subunit
MKKTKIKVMVSGLNNIDSPGPGVPVIRALRDSEYFDPEIIGLAYENLEPGAYLHDIVDRTYKMPYPSEGSEAVLERIRYIQNIEQAQVLIPNFDSELFSFMKAEKQLNAMGISTFMCTPAQFEERHKSNLPDFGRRYDVKVPFSKAIMSYAELLRIPADFSFPVVIKGKFYDANIAYDLTQAGIYYNKISSKWGLPVIVQEYVTGTEVNVVALGDGKGNTVGAVPMRKQYITDKGKAWGGITLDDDSMLQLTRHIIGRTKWRGGMELELIRTAKNELYLIEINPRLPAWVYLAVGAGQNLPEALLKLALGMDVMPFSKYEVGKMFIRYSWDLICDLQEFEKMATKGEL